MALATLLMWPLGSLVRGLPYLVAVCWILTAALYDVNVVLQQSLFLVAYFYLSNLLERLLARYLQMDIDRLLFSSFINTSALVVLLVGFLGLSPFAFLKPVSSNSEGSVFLSFATFFYALFLQLVEPVVMFIEMVMVIRLIFAIGERLREKVFEGGREEDFLSFYKVIVIIGTVLNYGLSLAGTIYLCKQESNLFAFLFIIVFLGNIVLAIVSISYEHIIIDPSLMALYTSYLIYLASVESHVVSYKAPYNRHGLPSTVIEQQEHHFDMLFSALTRLEFTLSAVKKGLLSIALQLSPLFWVAFALRIKCLTAFLEGQLCQQFFTSGDDEDDDLTEGDDYDTDQQQIWSTIKSMLSTLNPLVPTRSAVVRIAVVLGFTSTLLQRFSPPSSSGSSWLFLIARHQWMVRLLQTFAAALFYVFALDTVEGDI